MPDDDIGFDLAAVTKDLRRWWRDTVEDDPFGLPKPPKGTICDALPALDSLSAQDATLTMEKHVDFSIPPEIVRRGGYTDVDDMVNDLTTKLKAMAGTHKVKAKKATKSSAAAEKQA